MGVIFKYNNKIIDNSKIENISLLIKLGKEFEKENFRYNEKYVIELLKSKSKIFEIDEFGIECPYSDLVFMGNQCFTGKGESGVYPSSEYELKLLIESYNEAVKVFGKDKVRIVVYSNYLYENFNELDFSLEEFLKNFSLIN